MVPFKTLQAAFRLDAPIDVFAQEEVAQIVEEYIPLVRLDQPLLNLKSEPKVVGELWMQSSAYNSLEGQTDGSPHITASGTFTREGVVASNYFPIGTKVRFPDHFGDKVFRVEDRMNKRYNKVIDVWMEEKSDAIAYGRRTVRVEIVK